MSSKLKNVRFECELINLVKENKILWDPKHEDFKSRSLRDAVWSEMGVKLSRDGLECKRRWTTLRDRYIRIKKLNCYTDSTKRKWAYFDSLKFLELQEDDTDEIESEKCDTSASNKIQETLLENPNVCAENDAEQYREKITICSTAMETSTLKNEIFPSDATLLEPYRVVDQTHYTTMTNVNPTPPPNNVSRIKLFFDQLALKVEESRLPKQVLNQLERRIIGIVYDCLEKYDQDLK